MDGAVKGAVTVARFCGSTASSSDLASLLGSLCRNIAVAYGCCLKQARLSRALLMLACMFVCMLRNWGVFCFGSLVSVSVDYGCYLKQVRLRAIRELLHVLA